MKGYKISNILYVFPQDAAEIPYVDPEVTVIYIQHEQVNAFKEYNQSVVDLIQGYNYNSMTINKKVWADHLDDDIVNPEPPVGTYSLTVAGAQCGEVSTDNLTTSVHYEPASTNQVAENDTIRSTANENSTFDITSAEEKRKLVATFNSEALTPSLDGTYVEFTMPNVDSTIIIDEYTPAPATYVLTVDDQTSDDVIQIRPRTVDPSAVEEGTEVQAIISNAGQTLGYTFDTTAQAPAIPIIATLDGVQLTKDVDTESVSFTMPGSNATLVITDYTPL